MAGHHRYGLEWEAHRQSFHLDGNLVYTTTVSMPERRYIQLSFQFGSASGAGLTVHAGKAAALAPEDAALYFPRRSENGRAVR